MFTCVCIAWHPPCGSYVQEVGSGVVWCAFSPNIRGRAYATQVGSCLSEASHGCCIPCCLSESFAWLLHTLLPQ